MSEYEVVVITRVKEIYVVNAESENDARGKWHETEPVFSECIEVEEIESVTEATDD